MKVDGIPFRTIWPAADDPGAVEIIDQRHLPHRFVIERLASVDAVAAAIRDMHVRGAGLIGATAGWGMYLAAREAADLPALRALGDRLKATRPTAVNLAWAVDRQLAALEPVADPRARIAQARQLAATIADEDAECCRQIGLHGLDIIRRIAARKPGQPVHILTHCNAGWLAFVDHGSATGPIYAAFEAGLPIHVWVDETRPRNQGARLTAWELGKHGIPHTLITDNAGGHLMQHGRVDMVIVGTDRTTRAGDVANKIGTYLKALAARDNDIPFFVALPSSTFDWAITDGITDIPIEERDPDEIRYVQGWAGNESARVLISPEDCASANPAFDVTPARLVTGFITERGVCDASENAIKGLFSDKFTAQ